MALRWTSLGYWWCTTLRRQSKRGFVDLRHKKCIQFQVFIVIRAWTRILDPNAKLACFIKYLRPLLRDQRSLCTQRQSRCRGLGLEDLLANANISFLQGRDQEPEEHCGVVEDICGGEREEVAKRSRLEITWRMGPSMYIVDIRFSVRYICSCAHLSIFKDQSTNYSSSKSCLSIYTTGSLTQWQKTSRSMAFPCEPK